MNNNIPTRALDLSTFFDSLVENGFRIHHSQALSLESIILPSLYTYPVPVVDDYGATRPSRVPSLRASRVNQNDSRYAITVHASWQKIVISITMRVNHQRPLTVFTCTYTPANAGSDPIRIIEGSAWENSESKATWQTLAQPIVRSIKTINPAALAKQEAAEKAEAAKQAAPTFQETIAAAMAAAKQEVMKEAIAAAMQDAIEQIKDSCMADAKAMVQKILAS